MRDLSPDPWKPMKGAGDQIDHQEQQDHTEPPRVIHIEKVKKVQHLIEADPVSLNIFRTGGILRDQCADDGKGRKQNEERNGELDGSKKVKEKGKETTFLWVDCFIRFFHKDLLSI